MSTRFDCLFCKIVQGEVPCKKVYEDEAIIVFHDIYPKAKTHLLVVPKQHVESLAALEIKDAAWVGELTVKLSQIAALVGLESGFRTIINTGKDGGQEIFHLHYHLLGGF